MIRDMARVRIIGLKPQCMKTIRAIQAANSLHIDSVRQDDFHTLPLTLDAAARERQQDLGYLLAQVEGQLELLGGAVDFAPRPSPPDLIEEVRTGLSRLAPVVQELTSRREAHLADLALLPRYQSILHKLMPALPASAHNPANITSGIFISRSYHNLLDDIENEMYAITSGQAETVALEVDADTQAMVLVFSAAFADKVEALLGRSGVSRLRLPGDMESQPLDTMLATLHQRTEDLPREIVEIEGQLAQLGKQWCEKLSYWQAALADELEAHRIVENFGATDKTFVIVGWVPVNELPTLRARLEADVGSEVLLQEVKLTPELRKQMPIALENFAPARPFEGLVRLRALPGSEDIDPTGLVALFMPFFFGMMLGDIGYGAVLLLIALGLVRRVRQGMARQLLLVLAVGAAWAIVFGAIFGEFFGTLGEHLGMHALLFDRASPKNMVSLLALAVGVGAVHQVLGLILGTWQAVQNRHPSHLLERGGMLVGLLALFLIVGVAVNALPPALMTPAVAALIVGLVLLGASMGWLGLLMGPLEFIGLIGNWLSYLRIAAIGLASVYLALVANEIAGLVGSLVVGLIIAVLIHALNILLGAFSPSIQSLRLQYVEFFRKFYEGGGRPYEPFGQHYTG